MSTEKRNQRLMEHIDFVKSINDRETRPIVIPFEGVTTVAPAAPAQMLWTVPEDRHVFIYSISGFIQEAVNGSLAANQADLLTQTEVQVQIDHELNLFGFGTSTGRINMSQIMGTMAHPRDGFDLKFPFHVRPGCDIVVDFFLLVFPAAVRRMGIALNCEIVKKLGSGI